MQQNLVNQYYSELTKNHNKAHLYAQETEAVEAIEQVMDLAGDEYGSLFFDVSVMMLKPEALKKRLGMKVIDFLTDNRWAPFFCVPVTLTRNIAHCVWRYQWNAATSDRVKLHTMIAEDTKWLLILIKDASEYPTVPSSVRLWGMKGSSMNAKREPHHLRSKLGMSNRMMGYVHTPDEPADIVRELGILFPSDTRSNLIQCALNKKDEQNIDSVRAKIETYESKVSAHSIDYQEVLGRNSINSDIKQDILAMHGVQNCRNAACESTELSLKTIFDFLDTQYVNLSKWDKYIIAAEHIKHDKDHVEPILDAGTYHVIAEKWKSVFAADRN